MGWSLSFEHPRTKCVYDTDTKGDRCPPSLSADTQTHANSAIASAMMAADVVIALLGTSTGPALDGHHLILSPGNPGVGAVTAPVFPRGIRLKVAELSATQ